MTFRLSETKKHQAILLVRAVQLGTTRQAELVGMIGGRTKTYEMLRLLKRLRLLTSDGGRLQIGPRAETYLKEWGVL